jgi:hypothetical protein
VDDLVVGLLLVLSFKSRSRLEITELETGVVVRREVLVQVLLLLLLSLVERALLAEVPCNNRPEILAGAVNCLLPRASVATVLR